MSICCVNGCNDEDNDVAYFPVPVAAGLRRKWQTALNVDNHRLHPDSRICSRHFKRTDYEEVRGKMRLKARVVPSRFLSDKKVQDESSRPTASRARKSQLEGQLDSWRENERLIDDETPVDLEMQDPAAARADDDSGECTIECVPEAILNHDTDSHSETDLPKEDIEDIIANYHIQQRQALATSTPAHRGGKEIDNHRKSESSSNKHTVQEADTNGTDDETNAGTNKEKADTSETESVKTADLPERAKETDGASERDGDTIEIEADPEDKAPEFIEISVDAGRKGRTSNEQDDCLLVLEKVEVDIDPSTLMLPDSTEDDRREDPISLVTSSDESDVILEEPHIDTVEVSSETDEDDKPLVALVKSKQKPTKLTRLLWGNLTEYFCYQCKFTTLSKAESEKHKLQHSKILLVCEVCSYTCGHCSQMTRHKKKHREERRFKCHYCDYRARHRMSLVYHMKSHEGMDPGDSKPQSILTVTGKYKCSDCRYVGNSRKNMMKHVKSCTAAKTKPKTTTHKCVKCSYSTKRRNDLKRHIERKHADVDDDVED